MNMKSILLGTAAGMMVATGALAADLPGEAPAAVDYVKVCDAFGAGFFYIPGGDTCLKINGRVRARATYFGSDTAADTIVFRADGRVAFDARTASDIGTVRSFFQINIDNGTRNILVTDMFIQVGYLQVGRFGNISNGDRWYGDEGVAWALGDQTGIGAAVVVDDLGGGFYAGVGIAGTDAVNTTRQIVWTDGLDADLSIDGKIGIANQPWGAIDLSAVYVATNNTVNNDQWGIKGTADLKLIDNLSLRLTASYNDWTDKNYNDYALTAAAKYQVTSAADVYAGLYYVNYDAVVTDKLAFQVGGDYVLTPGLTATAEFNYFHDLDVSNADSWNIMLGLARTW